MTRRAAGSGLRIPRIWVLPLGVLAAMLVAVGSGVLSRSLYLDLAAWWPVWFGVVVATILARGRRLGRLRASGLVPVVAFIAFVAFLMGHLQGWSLMPSGEVRLVGPPVGQVRQGLLEARIDGEIHLGSGSRFLYEVEPVRWGGEVGLPEATEEYRPAGGNPEGSQSAPLVAVLLQPRPDPGPYTFAGWDIRLAEEVEWNVGLSGRIDADLSDLSVSSFGAVGEGVVVLGSSPSPGAQVLLTGSFELVVPEGVPAQITGEALVPGRWERLDEGWRSPTAGAGWEVVVSVGSTVTVVEG
ncbi:MAG: hypothetical protein ACE5F5_11350 [Acidimicrobiia bacterium]